MMTSNVKTAAICFTNENDCLRIVATNRERERERKSFHYLCQLLTLNFNKWFGRVQEIETNDEDTLTRI